MDLKRLALPLMLFLAVIGSFAVYFDAKRTYKKSQESTVAHEVQTTNKTMQVTKTTQ